MAITYAFSGNLNINASFSDTFGTDGSGALNETLSRIATFAASGGTAPTVSGFWQATLTVTGAGDILLAHATNPAGSFGTATYSPGFTVASSKLKLFIVAADPGNGGNTIQVARKATLGLPIFDAAGDSVTLAASDLFVWHKVLGTAALTTGTNDGVTLTPSAGSPVCVILAAYGP